MKTLREIAVSLKQQLNLYKAVLCHPRTPATPRILLYLAVGYLCMPFDLIPDFIPIIGQLDDMVIIPLLVVLALRFIPKDIILECRLQQDKIRNA